MLKVAFIKDWTSRVCSLLAIVAGPNWALAQQEGKSTPSAKAGKVINLLKGVDVRRDRMSGPFQCDGKTLVAVPGDPATVYTIQFPFQPTGEYEITVTVEPTKASDDYYLARLRHRC
jgi:hypothetical protein